MESPPAAKHRRVEQESTYHGDLFNLGEAYQDDDAKSVKSHKSGASVSYGGAHRGDGIPISKIQYFLETGHAEGEDDEDDDDDFCWMCEYGLFVNNLQNKSEDEYVDRFRKYVQSGAAYKVQPEKFFLPIKEYYDSFVYPIHPEFGICSIEKFKRHFYIHMKEPTLYLRGMYDKIDTLLEDISNNILFDDETTGRRGVDKQNLSAFVKLADMRAKISRLDPVKMTGAEEGFTYSLEKVSKSLNDMSKTNLVKKKL